MSHDSRYESECQHGHGWYFHEDGCAVAGCENAPPSKAEPVVPVDKKCPTCGAPTYLVDANMDGDVHEYVFDRAAAALQTDNDASRPARDAAWQVVKELREVGSCTPGSLDKLDRALGAYDSPAPAAPVPHGRAPETLAHGQRCAHADCPLEAACSWCGGVCLLHCVGRSTAWRALKYFLRAWRRYVRHGRLV